MHTLKMMNASARKLRGLPKVHKEHMPLRPLINFTAAPGYTVAKILSKLIKENTRIIDNHSVNSYRDFIQVKNVKMQPGYKLVSFNIVDLYTNVPITDAIDILKENLVNNNTLDNQKIDQLLDILSHS